MKMLLRDQLMTAISIAVEAHRTQVDKIGMPYILHPLAVMQSLPQAAIDAMIVAVLHDVLEDTCVRASDLLHQGIAARLVFAVEALSKRDGEPLRSYYKRVRQNRLALRVKYLDIEHNLSPERQECLPAEDQQRLKEKYRVALLELGRK